MKKTESTATKKATKKATATATKKAESTATKKADAEVKQTMTQRRDAFMQTLKLTDRFCFENADVAVRPDDYAMLTQDNAIMIYLFSDDCMSSAKRVCEIWLHSRKANDFYINKRLFAQLCEKNETFSKLQDCINPKAKTSKMGLAIADEKDLTDWVNLFLTLI